MRSQGKHATFRTLVSALLAVGMALQLVPGDALAEAISPRPPAPAQAAAAALPLVAPNIVAHSPLTAEPTPEERAEQEAAQMRSEADDEARRQADERAQEQARLAAITVTVHLDGNGATGGMMADYAYLSDGQQHALPDNLFVREGFSFAGWSTTASGHDTLDDPLTPDADESLAATAVPDGQALANLAWDETTEVPDPDGPAGATRQETVTHDLNYAVGEDRTLTLYAQWEVVEPPSFDGMENTALAGEPTVTLPDPAPAGHAAPAGGLPAGDAAITQGDAPSGRPTALEGGLPEPSETAAAAEGAGGSHGSDDPATPADAPADGQAGRPAVEQADETGGQDGLADGAGESGDAAPAGQGRPTLGEALSGDEADGSEPLAPGLEGTPLRSYALRLIVGLAEGQEPRDKDALLAEHDGAALLGFDTEKALIEAESHYAATAAWCARDVALGMASADADGASTVAEGDATDGAPAAAEAAASADPAPTAAGDDATDGAAATTEGAATSTDTPAAVESDPEPVSALDNALARLDALEGADQPAASDAPAARERPLIALVDTGAPEGAALEGAASVLGDDGADRNGHAASVLAAVLAEDAAARVLSIKALGDDGRGSASAVYAAIVYAADAGADVINLSLAGADTEGNAAIAEAVAYARGRGCAVVAAAGNGGHDVAYVTPANAEGVITVGAADGDGNVLASSNRGACVDLYVQAASTSLAAARATGWLSANWATAASDPRAALVASALNSGAADPEDGTVPDSTDILEGAVDSYYYKYYSETQRLLLSSNGGDGYTQVTSASVHPWTNNSNIKNNCTEVIVSGEIVPTSLESFFDGMVKLTKITIEPYSAISPGIDASKAKSAKYMFRNCAELTSPIISKGLKFSSTLTSMYGMFYGCSSLNIFDLKSIFYIYNVGWSDFSNVTDMRYMFYNCTNLTEVELNDYTWQAASNIDASSMFYGCSALNNVKYFKTGSKVITTTEMFRGCSALTVLDFTGSGLDSAVTTKNMFRDCTSLTKVSFPENMNSWTTPGTAMFINCLELVSVKLPRSATAMTSFNDMFDYKENDTNYNQTPKLRTVTIPSKYNTSKDVTMKWMFYRQPALESISCWDSKIDSSARLTDISRMFGYCTSLNSDCLDIFKSVTTITDTTLMYVECTSLDIAHLSDLNNPPAVKTMKEMFKGCTGLTTVYMNLDAPAATDLSYMFQNCTALTTVDMNVNAPVATNLSYMFQNCTALEKMDCSYIKAGYKTSTSTSARYMFSGCSALSSFDYLGYYADYPDQGVNDISYMFEGCTSLERIVMPLNNNIMNMVTTTNYIFKGCINLQHVRFASYMNKWSSATSMFINCPELRIVDLPLYATKMTDGFKNMFLFGYDDKEQNTSKLWRVRIPAYLNNTASVSMYGMFYNQPALKNVYTSIKMGENKLNNCSYMFYGCRSLQDVTLDQIYMGALTNASYMFNGCTSLPSIKLPSVVTLKLSDTSYMFAGCSSLTTIRCESGTDWSSVKTATNMFFGCSNLVGGAGTRVKEKRDYSGTPAREDRGPNSVSYGYFTSSGATNTVHEQIVDMPYVTSTQSYEAQFADDTLYKFTVPKGEAGWYRLEGWGAQGGNGFVSTSNYSFNNDGVTDGEVLPGGAGGYSQGFVKLNEGDVIYACVGGQGTTRSNEDSTDCPGGFNGGGDGSVNATTYKAYWGAGGGATSYARVPGTIAEIGEGNIGSIYMVAGGGGGSGEPRYVKFSSKNYLGGAGGGADAGLVISGFGGKGGTQTAGGKSYLGKVTGGTSYPGFYGSFGVGGSGGSAGTSFGLGAGGGGGLYGGGGGSYASSSTDAEPRGIFGGGGGSGYASRSLKFASTVAGDVAGGIPNISTGELETGHLGNGFARITPVETVDINLYASGDRRKVDAYVFGDTLVGVDLSGGLPTEIGYSFIGYYTEQHGGNKVIDADGSLYDRSFSMDGVSTLYAHWSMIYNYEFVGDVREFKAYRTCRYILEAWGADGGYGAEQGAATFVPIDNSGGYSRGRLLLNKDESIYVVVGGVGEDADYPFIINNKYVPGGYNGGGLGAFDNNGEGAGAECGGGGGGATHFASITGELPTLKDNHQRVILVAGGGGGLNGWEISTDRVSVGGGKNAGMGGGSSAAGQAIAGSFVFGKGGDGAFGGYKSDGTAGGGGGWAGGLASSSSYCHAGGGSGRVGGATADLTNVDGGFSWDGFTVNSGKWLYDVGEDLRDITGLSYAGDNTLVKTTYAKPAAAGRNGYARVTADYDYIVEFWSNGGDGDMPFQAFLFDVEEPLNKCTFFKEKYKFIGWSTTPDGEVEYKDEASVKNLTLVPYNQEQNLGIVNLYAQWAPSRWTGEAYAVLRDNGQMVLFRAENLEDVADGTYDTYTDIAGNTYTGRLYAIDEYYDEGASTAPATAPWESVKDQIISVRVAEFPDTMPGYMEGYSYQAIEPAGLSHWFDGCENLTSARLNEVVTSYATSLDSLFKGCSALTSLDLSVMDTGTDASGTKATSAVSMFEGCTSLRTLGLDGFSFQKLENLSSMFKDCAALKALDLGSCEMPAATNTAHAFDGCASLARLDIHALGATRATDMEDMFAGCESLVSVALGEGFAFKGDSIEDEDKWTILPTHTPEHAWELGYWSNTDKDEHDYQLTAVQLRNRWTSDMADTWVWSKATQIFDIKLDSQREFEGSNGTDKVYEWYDEGVYLNCEDDDSTFLGRTCSDEMTASSNRIERPVQESREFLGYFTSAKPADGEEDTGVQMIDARGYRTANFVSTYFESDATLYARWAPVSLPYAVIDPATNVMYFVKSENVPVAVGDGSYRTLTDNDGVERTGIIYALKDIVAGTTSISSANDVLWVEDGNGVTVTSVVSFGTQPIAPASMAWWFKGFSSVESFDFAGFDTGETTDMQHLFDGCSRLEALDLSSFVTGSVTDMTGMFTGTTALRKVTLGEGFSFWGATSPEDAEEGETPEPLTALLDAPSTGGYTGNWTDGEHPLLAASLAEQYPNASAAPVGTWVWEKLQYEIVLHADDADDAGNADRARTESLWEWYDHGLYFDWECEQPYTVADPLVAPAKSGTEFLGYYTEPDGKGDQLVDAGGKPTEAFSNTYFDAGENTLDEDGKGHLYVRWKTDAPFAVLADDGTLYFVRSEDEPACDGTQESITDGDGIERTGVIWALEDVGEISSVGDVPWWKSGIDPKRVKEVVSFVGQPITPASTAWWFAGCSELTEANLSGLATRAATEDMQHMFDECDALVSVTMPGTFSFKGKDGALGAGLATKLPTHVEDGVWVNGAYARTAAELANMFASADEQLARKAPAGTWVWTLGDMRFTETGGRGENLVAAWIAAAAVAAAAYTIRRRRRRP